MNPIISEISPQIKTVIFDFGGVLFDIDYEAPARAFEELGMTNFLDLYSKANQSDIFDRLETGKVTNTEFYDFIRQVSGLKSSDLQLRDAWNAILIGLAEERSRWVQKVHEKFQTFILSNTNAIHVEAFEQMIDNSVGLSKFKSGFDAVLYSNEIGLRKPHAGTFEWVLRNYHLEPKSTLFIDDSKQHVEGARSTGMHAYYLDLGVENVETALAALLP